jgi:hypothetical protein
MNPHCDCGWDRHGLVDPEEWPGSGGAPNALVRETEPSHPSRVHVWRQSDDKRERRFRDGIRSAVD